MKPDNSFKLVLALIVTGIFIVLFSSAHAAEAKPKAKHAHVRIGAFQSSNGNSGTFASTVTRGGGETTRNGTATNQKGQTATHTADRKYDKTTGTGTVASSTTDFDGDTMSRQGTFTRNADGTVSSQGTLTGYHGKTATYADTTTKSATGSTTTGTITGANGKTSTVNSTLTKNAPGDVTRDTTVTGANGKKLERDVATKINADGTGTRVVEVTKPDGSTETRTETFAVTDTGASKP